MMVVYTVAAIIVAQGRGCLLTALLAIGPAFRSHLIVEGYLAQRHSCVLLMYIKPPG